MASAENPSDQTPAQRRQLSEMEQICKRYECGPFSSVRLEMYAAMESLASPESPKLLAALGHAAKELAASQVRKKYEGMEGDQGNGGGRRRWPDVIKMILRVLPRAEVALNGTQPIKQGWSAVATPVTGFIEDWTLHADGVIVCAVVAALGELTESRFEELAGLLHYHRGPEALVRTARIIELLCSKGTLRKGKNEAGDLFVALPEPEKTLRLHPQESLESSASAGGPNADAVAQ